MLPKIPEVMMRHELNFLNKQQRKTLVPVFESVVKLAKHGYGIERTASVWKNKYTGVKQDYTSYLYESNNRALTAMIPNFIRNRNTST